MSSLNLVFFTHFISALFYGPIFKKQLNASYGADHTVTDSLRIICIENMSVTAKHIICKKIMHSLLLPYGEIKIYSKQLCHSYPTQ